MLSPSLHQPCKCTPHSESQSPSQVISSCRYGEKNIPFSIFKINCCGFFVFVFVFTVLISSLPWGEGESIHPPPQGAVYEAVSQKVQLLVGGFWKNGRTGSTRHLCPSWTVTLMESVCCNSFGTQESPEGLHCPGKDFNTPLT